MIDDISALRQMTPDVIAADVHLFKPADAYVYTHGGDNGTPTQMDEAQAENRPEGAFIDYYLKSASSTPVTLEVLDATGKVMHTFSSDPALQRRGGAAGAVGGIPKVSPLWTTQPEPFSAAAGLHRVVWNPVVEVPAVPGADGFDRGPLTAATGTFTARLSAGGKTYTQVFNILSS